MRRVLRVILDSVVEGAIKRLAAQARLDEAVTDREYFQHYGFTSRPLPGAEGILLREGGVIYMIASDDRRYRLALENGEVALYDDQGQKVHLKRNKEIEVSGCDTLVATVGVKTTLTSPEIEFNCERFNMTASESVLITTKSYDLNYG